MKKIYSLIAMLGLASQFTQAQNIVDITDADLVAGQTYNWTNTNVYLCEGTVFVEDGAILNIEAGTVIKFKPNVSGTDPSALIICRGAKMFATGTVNDPIIFTAEADDLSDPTDLGPTDNALWGGIALLGKAYTTKNGNTEVNVEGIPTTEPRGVYGMPAGQNVDNDNSGVMRYCSIRHGGSALTSGSELNGLSLAAVGSGTTLEYIDVYANSDDGIEFFGGTVNLKYASVAFCEDDSYDWDETYTGKGQFWFSIQRDDVADNGWECDGSTPDNTTPFSDPTVYNATHIGSGAAGAAGNATGWLLRAGTRGLVANSIVTEMKNKAIEVQDRPSNTTTDAYSQLVAGELVIKNNLFWNCGSNTNIDMTSSGIIRSTVTSGLGGEDSVCTALINHLNTNSNLIQNPQIVNVSRTQNALLDPRPSSAGAAYSTALAANPSGDAFFSAVSYKGAFSAEASELWLHKWSTLFKNGHLSPVASIEEKESDIFSAEVYPNPAKENINIALFANNPTDVKIFDNKGALVKVIAQQKSGIIRENINTSDLTSGLYIVLISDGTHTTNKKIVIE
jgi:hypothetical protein